jgi:hypothetical protein
MRRNTWVADPGFGAVPDRRMSRAVLKVREAPLDLPHLKTRRSPADHADPREL